MENKSKGSKFYLDSGLGDTSRKEEQENYDLREDQ